MSGSCVPRTCVPGAVDCNSAITRRVCNTDGLGYTATTCGTMSSCTAGACVPWLCTPGTAFCSDDRTARTCTSTGLGYTDETCASDEVCDAGACISRPSFALQRRTANTDVIATIDPITYSSQFTLELWAAFDSVRPSDPAQKLVAACSAGHRCLFIELYQSQIQCTIGNGSGFERFSIPLASITSGTWHHYSCEYDGTNVRFYLDGVIIDQRAGTYLPPAAGTPFYVAYEDFTGWVDEVHLMNTAVRGGAFTPAAEYDHASDVLRFHMNEGAGMQIVDDVSGGPSHLEHVDI